MKIVKVICSSILIMLCLSGCAANNEKPIKKVAKQSNTVEQPISGLKHTPEPEVMTNDRLGIIDIKPYNHGFELTGKATLRKGEHITAVVEDGATEVELGDYAVYFDDGKDDSFFLSTYEGLAPNKAYVAEIRITSSLNETIDSKTIAFRTTNISSKPKGVKDVSYSINNETASIQYTRLGDPNVKQIHFEAIDGSYKAITKSNQDGVVSEDQLEDMPFDYSEIKGKTIRIYTTDGNNNKSSFETIDIP
ncbi:hypothetical protein [Gottfriedia acidiceleris]|uniref:hypothetical protein n=1 Tax=Gottfriedia acidiceleris TaxID=371036 RepID=UPI002FFDAD68